MAIPLNDEFLKEKARPIVIFNGRIRKLAANMIQTMYALRGIGLAGPQVGYGLRIFVLRKDMVPVGVKDMVFINPQLVRIGVKTYEAQEGCLSHKDILKTVERADFVLISYRNLAGKERKASFHGFPARVVQHELDHLDGICITDQESK